MNKAASLLGIIASLIPLSLDGDSISAEREFQERQQPQYKVSQVMRKCMRDKKSSPQ